MSSPDELLVEWAAAMGPEIDDTNRWLAIDCWAAITRGAHHPDEPKCMLVGRTYSADECRALLAWRAQDDQAQDDSGPACEGCGKPADWTGEGERVQCDCGATVCASCCESFEGESYCPGCVLSLAGGDDTP